MPHKLNLSIEAHDPKERDELMQELTDVLNNHRATTRTFKITYEEQTMRGKKTVTETLEFSPGETIEIEEFGMLVERPLEAALRNLEGTTITAGDRSVTIGRRKPSGSQRIWDDDEYKIQAETADESRLTGER